MYSKWTQQRREWRATAGEEVKWGGDAEDRRGSGSGWEGVGGRSAQPRWRGKVEPDGHQMNKLWRAPFCRMGVNLPLQPQPPAQPPPLLLLQLLLSSLTVQFPPLASLLLPANCEWSLIIGPPYSPSVRGYRSVWERRLECQNVIRDSRQSERRRSHTRRPGILSERNKAQVIYLLRTRTKKKRRKLCKQKIFFIKIVVGIVIFIHPVHICLIHELQRKIQYVSASCQSNTDIRRQLCSNKDNKMDSGLKYIGFQPTKSNSHVHGESEFSEQNWFTCFTNIPDGECTGALWA